MFVNFQLSETSFPPIMLIAINKHGVNLIDPQSKVNGAELFRSYRSFFCCTHFDDFILSSVCFTHKVLQSLEVLSA